jgi:hypothetical protein
MSDDFTIPSVGLGNGATLTMADIIDALKGFQTIEDDDAARAMGFSRASSLLTQFKPMQLPKLKPVPYMPEMGLFIGLDHGLDSVSWARTSLLGMAGGGGFYLLDSDIHITKKGRRILARLGGRLNRKKNRKSRRARIQRRGF